MSPKQNIVNIAAQISAIETSSLLFHKNRFLALLKRGNCVVNLVKDNVSEEAVDMSISHSLTQLSITLEEILEYVVLFSKKDKYLAAHIIKYGSDEEQFLKWTERLQHFVVELDFAAKLVGIFDEVSDMDNFLQDIAALRLEMVEIVVLIHGTENEVLLKNLDDLIVHQHNVRATYQTKLSPTADIEIIPKKIKYENIIGHGGFRFINE